MAIALATILTDIDLGLAVLRPFAAADPRAALAVQLVSAATDVLGRLTTSVPIEVDDLGLALLASLKAQLAELGEASII